MRLWNTVIPLYLLVIISAAGYCNNKKIKTIADTIIIAQVNNPVIINNAQPMAEIMLKPAPVQAVSDPVYLQFNATLNKNPDGVYEVYISPEKLQNLSPSAPYFINVLDVYGVTDQKSITFKIPEQTITLSKDIHLTILFRGNQLTGNAPSTNAGVQDVKRG